MAFTKGVHRFAFEVVVGDYTGTVPYKATDDEEWQRLSDIGTYSDALYPENYAGTIVDALNKVFDNKCVLLENIDGNTNRVGIGLPNADGVGTSNFTLELSGSWVRGTAVDLNNTQGRFKLGVTTNDNFNATNNDFAMGRYIYLNSSSIPTASFASSSDFKAKTPLVIKVYITDNFYAIGVVNYYDLSTLNMAKSAFIDNNIIIGKTNTNKDYMLYPIGYDSNVRDEKSASTCIIVKDSNGVDTASNMIFEHPYTTHSGCAKLNPISIGNHNTGWYYASYYYDSTYGDWNKSAGVVNKSLCLGDYLTIGMVENVFTINNKSFDALLGYHQQYNRNGLYREHVNNS